jgi:serine/threonine-protein kinase
MALTSGVKLGPYEIVSLLGAGGMGEVYRARDTKLNREVALKVLPEVFASDPQRMARFEREAQVLASLNHPNIASIYGLEESGSRRALVMELVEGPTLGEQLSAAAVSSPPPGSSKSKALGGETDATTRGRMGADTVGAGWKPTPIEDVLGIAKQITEALEYAHERGIVHRDLKPANIKINHEGVVKVLDFGLAKALDTSVAAIPSSPAAGAPPQDSPTFSAVATQAGVILGTAAYMSPEQVRGKTVDRRADIWAFGCVLYEMLTGQQPFAGESVSDTLAAVIKDAPNWETLPASTPRSMRRLLERCLDKDPKHRLQAIGEARIAIEETLSGVGADLSVRPAGGIGPSAHTGTPLRLLPWVAMGLIAGALLSGVVVWRLASPALQSAMHFTSVTNFAGVQAQPALSPDGRSVAFVSNRDGHYNIYVGLVRGGNLLQITHVPNLESRPTWSPDGTMIAYARLNHSGIWDIWEVPALGGTPRRLILNATDPAYSPDGRSLAYENTADGGIWISGISGENARQVAPAQGPGMQNTEPRFSPDGRELAFTNKSPGPYSELEVLDLASGKVRQLTHDIALALSPAWSPDGRSIYFASGRGGSMNIWKIAATGGEPEQITAGQGDDAELDISSDGKRIVFSTFRENINVVQLDLEAKAGQQNPKPLTTDPARNQVAPVYSADGKLLAYFSNYKGVEKEGIWVANADGSNPVQLVQDGRINIFPQWTPDNQHLIYLSRSQVAPGRSDEYRTVAVSGGAPQTILGNAADRNFDVGPQGQLLSRSFGSEIQSFDPSNNKTQTLGTLLASKGWRILRWSPDGRSVAYVLDASREDDPNAGFWVNDFKAAPRQIFRGWVLWYARGPGNEIYFLEGKPDLNGVLWKVAWNGQGLTRTSTTIRLIHSYWTQLVRDSQDFFDVSPDGRHLAVNAQGALQANIGMIENVR